MSTYVCFRLCFSVCVYPLTLVNSKCIFVVDLDSDSKFDPTFVVDSNAESKFDPTFVVDSDAELNSDSSSSLKCDRCNKILKSREGYHIHRNFYCGKTSIAPNLGLHLTRHSQYKFVCRYM